jgi:hypothetical protein
LIFPKEKGFPISLPLNHPNPPRLQAHIMENNSQARKSDGNRNATEPQGEKRPKLALIKRTCSECHAAQVSLHPVRRFFNVGNK